MNEKGKKIKNGLTYATKCNYNNVATSKTVRFSSSVEQHRERQHYVYIRELVTFMERTVTIVTRRSAITGIHTRTRIFATKKNKTRQSSYMLT